MNDVPDPAALEHLLSGSNLDLVAGYVYLIEKGDLNSAAILLAEIDLRGLDHWVPRNALRPN